MKNFPLLSVLSVSALLFASCNTDCQDASGNQVSETRDVGNFTGIEISGGMRLVITQGGASSVRVVADDNIQKEVKTRVSGGDLEIEHDSGTCQSGEIIVYVTTTELNKIDAQGAVEISSQGRITSQDFELSLSGANSVKLDINASTVYTRSSGASEITLSGQAGKHGLELSGSTNVDAFDFTVGEYSIESSGSGSAEINVLNRLDAEASGASEILYKGNPAKVDANNSGASTIRKVN